MGGGSSTIKKLQADAKIAHEPHLLILNDYKGYNEMYMMRLSEAPEYLKEHFRMYSIPRGHVYEMFAEDWVEKASPPKTLWRQRAAWQWLTEGKRFPAISGSTWNIAHVIYLKF